MGAEDGTLRFWWAALALQERSENHPRGAGTAPGKSWGSLGLASNHESVSRASCEPSSIPSGGRRAVTPHYGLMPQDFSFYIFYTFVTLPFFSVELSTPYPA